MVGTVGLLTMNEDAVRRVVEVAERRLPEMRGTRSDIARARSWLRSLTEGAPPTIDRDIDGGGVGAGSLWILCREILDVGEPELALSVIRVGTRPSPHGHAVLAAVEGAATGSVDRWHAALRLAAANGLRLVAVNALEAIAVNAARAESWTEHARLVAAAQRLREETGYRWRYRFERDALDGAVAANPWATDRRLPLARSRWSGTKQRRTPDGLGVSASARATAGPASRRPSCKSPTRRRRTDQPADRPASDDGPGNGEVTPRARVHQARRSDASGAGGSGHPAQRIRRDRPPMSIRQMADVPRVCRRSMEP